MTKESSRTCPIIILTKEIYSQCYFPKLAVRLRECRQKNSCVEGISTRTSSRVLTRIDRLFLSNRDSPSGK